MLYFGCFFAFSFVSCFFTICLSPFTTFHSSFNCAPNPQNPYPQHYNLPTNDSLSGELFSNMFNGFLLALDTTLTIYDIHTAKSYFGFVTQLLKDEASMRLLLQNSLSLMEKLTVDQI
jgi:hypothetical protein